MLYQLDLLSSKRIIIISRSVCTYFLKSFHYCLCLEWENDNCKTELLDSITSWCSDSQHAEYVEQNGCMKLKSVQNVYAPDATSLPMMEKLVTRKNCVIPSPFGYYLLLSKYPNSALYLTHTYTQTHRHTHTYTHTHTHMLTCMHAYTTACTNNCACKSSH